MRSIGSATYSGWTAVALVVSLGVAIQNAHDRLNTELLGFLMGTTVEGRVPPAPIERVWWKVGHVFGTAQPVLDGVSAAEQLALSKAFFDVMWSVTLEEILTDTPSVDDPAHREFARSAALTTSSRAHASQVTSFEELTRASTGVTSCSTSTQNSGWLVQSRTCFRLPRNRVLPRCIPHHPSDVTSP
jgi:hypothetical protein